jgi:hypothetical protein
MKVPWAKTSTHSCSKRQIEMTPEQLREHRRSFVYGNTHIENDRITREMVAEVDERIEAEVK